MTGAIRNKILIEKPPPNIRTTNIKGIKANPKLMIPEITTDRTNTIFGIYIFLTRAPAFNIHLEASTVHCAKKCQIK
jgi:hypothetical protein